MPEKYGNMKRQKMENLKKTKMENGKRKYKNEKYQKYDIQMYINSLKTLDLLTRFYQNKYKTWYSNTRPYNRVDVLTE